MYIYNIKINEYLLQNHDRFKRIKLKTFIFIAKANAPLNLASIMLLHLQGKIFETLAIVTILAWFVLPHSAQ